MERLYTTSNSGGPWKPTFRDDDPQWWLKFVPKTSIFWTDVNIARFLRLYQSHPILWDPRHPERTNRWLRLAAFRKIAKALKLKNVDENECLKLVEQLKKHYINEKEFPKRGHNQYRPCWFKILDHIIWRILHPVEEREPSFTSFSNCRECCEIQNLNAPCCRFRSSISDCEDEDESDDSCKAQVSQENLPCIREFKCPGISEKVNKLLLINFGKIFDVDDDSNCGCMDVSSSSSSECEDFAEDEQTSEEESEPFCLQDFIMCCTADDNESQTKTSTTQSGSDDEAPCPPPPGLFTDSPARLCGKVISLAADAPRRHFAPCADGQFYPLQLEM